MMGMSGCVQGTEPLRLGWPSRAADLDALPGFQQPPAGYGEVPFWWWSGEALDEDRLLWQLRQLHRMGISGVQVNYSHRDTDGWPTDVDEPAIFSDAWWRIYSRISEECARLDMGIGLSTYTLDWPWGGDNLFRELFYSKAALNALELVEPRRTRLDAGAQLDMALGERSVGVRAYALVDGQLQAGGIDLSEFIVDGQLRWTAPEGTWEVWEFSYQRKPGTLNALLADSGAAVIRDFFQPFEENNPGSGSEGLNYFFNDELHIGADKYAWCTDFAEQFAVRKGYDLLDVLPALWTDLGDRTPKVLMDYADVRMSLMEERYFKPIHDWHAERGIVFGCDSQGRGTRPNEFGDYFRVTRWYTAPGHDTPGGQADLIKGRVSASVANLYQQPRVWLEGYHSLGWGATPERLMFATRENYLYGCSLLNLHGLYYTTLGSFWEWAPPCYHFRMPYWEHMSVFLGYFDRLSYLMSQGHLVCDVAIVYPVAPYEAEMGGERATASAFELGRQLIAAGINFEFIDHESLSGARVEAGRLVVESAQTAYQTLVFADMAAVRWGSLAKAAEFAAGGGQVLALGALPEASDRRGRNDPVLGAVCEQAFARASRLDTAEAVVNRIQSATPQDVRGESRVVRAQHRRVGFRDVYMVMDAEPGDIVEFRAKGRVELWDPWTGGTRPLRVLGETPTGTRVELPLEAYEAQIVVFTEGESHQNPADDQSEVLGERLLDGDWQVSFEPTMDNRYGDFRVPVREDNQLIGVETRRFKWAPGTAELEASGMRTDLDDREWREQQVGFGPKFYQLGPLPDSIDPAIADAQLAQLREVDPEQPVVLQGQTFYWQTYDFSWRYGHLEDRGHQGFHGSKGTVSADFIRLGELVSRPNGVRSLEGAAAGRRYYLWTCAAVDAPTQADLLTSTAAPAVRNGSPVIAPAALFLNGASVRPDAETVSLQAGANPLLMRFESHGQAHVVLRRRGAAEFLSAVPLSMPWYQDPAVIPYTVCDGARRAEWFRFITAPGTKAIQVDAMTLEAPQVWIDGEPMRASGQGRYTVTEAPEGAALVALRLVPQLGYAGGAALQEAVQIETSGAGKLPLGDWAKVGVLHNYSGGVRYRQVLELSAAEVAAQCELDLGRVRATAEVFIDGVSAGVRVAPPWRFDLSGKVHAGVNQIEVLVYNTLSNHYQTIPTLFKGDPESGLMGPVVLKFAISNESGR